MAGVAPKVASLVRIKRTAERADWEARCLELTVTSVNMQKRTFVGAGIGGGRYRVWKLVNTPWSDIEEVLMDKSNRSKRGVGDTAGIRKRKARPTAAPLRHVHNPNPASGIGNDDAGAGGGGAGSSSGPAVVDLDEAAPPPSLIERDLSPVFRALHLADKLAAAVAWCTSQGADTVAELVEAQEVDNLLAALALLPIKHTLLKQRLQAMQMPVAHGLPVGN